MSRKALGKTIARTGIAAFRSTDESHKKQYRFLEGVKFTYITSVLLPGDDEATRLIEFTLPTLKKLLKDQHRTILAAAEAADSKVAAADKASRAAAAKLSKAKLALAKSQHALEQMRDAKEKLEVQRLEQARASAELAEKLAQSEARYEVLERNYQVLLRNIDEEVEPLDQGRMSVAGDWSTITNPKPLPGSYGTKKRR